MGHRFQAEGAKPMYAWCAVDPFLIGAVIGRPALVESKDPVTGEPIRMTVTPAGIADLSPAEAVVCFLKPEKAFDRDVIQTFCQYVLFFASRSSAQRWASERHGIILLRVADAFQVGRLAWSSFGRAAD
jgi:alkylmercury lyase